MKNRSFEKQLNDNKKFIYPISILLAGLLVGVILYKYSNNTFHSAVSNMFIVKGASFTEELINHFCIYFTMFSITILLGLCLVGFQFTSLIILLIGVELSIKLSYFYTTYAVKGIGYSILMIIPEASAFITILIFTIIKSNELSRNIFDLISKKEGMIEKINLKSYLKLFTLYGFLIALISLVNSTCGFFLSSIINI